MKRLFFLLTALLTLSVGMWAQTQFVTYIDENGVAQTVDSDDVTEITNSTTTLNAGWYVVTGHNVQTGYLTCNGEVHLILADGAILRAMGEYFQAGIQVSGEGNSLSIYGQDDQSGILFAAGGKSAAGIGGGLHNSGSGSNITINGGRVTATGGDGAAGIGGGYNGSGSNITINGGTVSATGEDHAAGIGGGYGGSGSNITIKGGRVTATGGEFAAGIGGGHQGSGSNITIKGGTVSAKGGYYGGSGIGGGYSGDGSYITINGGDVTATGGDGATGIGGGNQGSGSNITINGGTVTANGGYYGDSGIGGGFNGSGSDIFMPVNYRIKAGGTFIHNDGTDLAGSLAGKRNVEAYPDELLNERNAAFDAISAAVEGISDEAILAMADAAMEAVFQAESLNDINIVLAKINAIAEITTAREGIQNEFVNLRIDAAITDINKPGTDTEEKVNNIKDKIFDLIEAFQEGKTEGKAEALGEMGEPCTGCPAVVVTKGDKSVKLYQPDKVEFIMESEAK